jgi:hypothetical protein
MKTYKEFKKNLNEADGDTEIDPTKIFEPSARTKEEILSYKFDTEKKMMSSFNVFTRLFIDWIQHAHKTKEIDVSDRNYAEYRLHDILSVMIGNAINKSETFRNIIGGGGKAITQNQDSKKEISKAFKKLEKPLHDFILTYIDKVEEMKKIDAKHQQKADKALEKTDESKKKAKK